MGRALPEATSPGRGEASRPHDAKRLDDPRFQAGTTSRSRLPRRDPDRPSTTDPEGRPTMRPSPGSARSLPGSRGPALGASAIDEIREHTARSRIPVDFTRTGTALGGLVSGEASLRRFRGSDRPSRGMARRAIASVSGGSACASPVVFEQPLRGRVSPARVVRDPGAPVRCGRACFPTDALGHPGAAFGRWRPREGRKLPDRGAALPPLREEKERRCPEASSAVVPRFGIASRGGSRSLVDVPRSSRLADGVNPGPEVHLCPAIAIESR